jgi:hypothetical protein
MAVLAAGGKVSVLTLDGKSEVSDSAKLPNGDFEVTEVALTGRPSRRRVPGGTKVVPLTHAEWYFSSPLLPKQRREIAAAT